MPEQPLKRRIYVREAEEPEQDDICGSSIDLINASISQSVGISLATIYIEPGAASRPHFHKLMEEIYYFLEGQGKVVVGDERFVVEPGATVYIPVGLMHSVTNDGVSRLKFLSADAPSFDFEDIYFE